MGRPPDQRTPEEQQQIARFKHLTEQILPALAREQHWPIRFDHCFKRICLDHAFGDVWYNHLPKPAEKNLAGAALERAVACAEEIVAEGLTVLRDRDAASLRYRGKRAKSAPSVHQENAKCIVSEQKNVRVPPSTQNDGEPVASDV